MVHHIGRNIIQRGYFGEISMTLKPVRAGMLIAKKRNLMVIHSPAMKIVVEWTHIYSESSPISRINREEI